jgi:nitrogen fixation/metabolism regulation signal transduction histidine kinase
MNDSSTPVNVSMALRDRAQALLEAKGASLTAAKDPSRALRVLFDLASSPDTAPDALALLHELQVHQVELDLQQEELQRSRAELEAAWAYQLQWHDASPSAQLVIDETGRLMECNAGALKALQQDLQSVLGRRLETWVAPSDVPAVRAWLAHAQASPQSTACRFALQESAAGRRAVVAAARANPMASGVLVAWVDDVAEA